MLAGFALAIGCAQQDCLRLPCLQPNAVTLYVRDALDAGPVNDAVVNGVPCRSSVCVPVQSDGGQLGAGPVSLEVTAPGYRQVELDVEVPPWTPEPCTCQVGFVPQTRDVLLTPLF